MIIAKPYSPLASPLKNKKENKNKSYNKKLHHPMNFLEEFITPPMSLTLYAPKGKARANSLTNGYAVLPGEDRATLESDLSALGSPSRGFTSENSDLALYG
jgi:hypothetical protein